MIDPRTLAALRELERLAQQAEHEAGPCCGDFEKGEADAFTHARDVVRDAHGLVERHDYPVTHWVDQDGNEYPIA